MIVRGEDDLARLATSFNAMADSLQRQITQLEGLSQLQQRFTSDVSHELRTPLTTVQMAADVLHDARGDFPPHVARSAELLRAELDRFEGLLTDLLEISRYDAGAAVLDSEPVDLGALVARVVAGMWALAERHDSELVVNRPDEDVIADVDARRVERILRNLVGNAIEHGAGKPIEITLAANRTAAAVTVRDFGVGPELGRGAARLRPVLAGRPLAGAHRGRQRARAVDQPRGRPPARRLAAGLGPARRRRPVPAHAAADRRRRPHQLAAAAAPGRRPPSGGAGMSRRPASRAGRRSWRCCSAAERLLDGARAARRRCRSPMRRPGPSEIGRHRAAPARARRDAGGDRPRVHRRRGERAPRPPGGQAAPHARAPRRRGPTRAASRCSARTSRRSPPAPGRSR